jgi:hypothetical protein
MKKPIRIVLRRKTFSHFVLLLDIGFPLKYTLNTEENEITI